MRRCKNCGAELNDDCLFCTECGKSIPQGLVCPHCGASVNEGDIFCSECGKNINEVSVEQSEEQESPKTPDVSESNTSKKILTIIVAVFVLAILGGGWWSYKSSKEEVANTDSLLMANLGEVEDVEDVKLTKFRKSFTIKNVLNLVANPESKSAAQKCGLEFIYKDTQREELDESDYVDYYDIVYGYDVEKGNKNEGMGYIIKATSEHSCYFRYVRGQDDGYYLYFKDKADVDYLIDIAKDNGKCEISSPESENGWYRIYLLRSLSSYEVSETSDNIQSNMRICSKCGKKYDPQKEPISSNEYCYNDYPQTCKTCGKTYTINSSGTGACLGTCGPCYQRHLSGKIIEWATQ